MAKEDPGGINYEPIPISVGKITFQEVQKIFIDTNTGNVDGFHPVAYAANKTKSDTPTLHKAMRGTYIEGFIYDMKYDIEAIQKNKV